MRPMTFAIFGVPLVAAFLASDAVVAQYQPSDGALADSAASDDSAIRLPAVTPAIERLPPTADPHETSAIDDNPGQSIGPTTDGPPKHGSGPDLPSMGGPGMGGPGMGGPGYVAAWYPSSPVSGSSPATYMGIVRQNLSAAFPLWTDGRDMFMVTTGVQDSLFSTDAVLPDTHQAFPDELWNINLGTNYMHKFDNGWMGMAGVNFGSASDKPFHSINEMNVGFMGLLQVPAKNERDKWNFMLMYSPIGNLNFPIPGIAYLWNPSDRFRASIGIPLSITWRPTDALTLDVSYMPLITVNAMATYKLADRVSLYGGFQSLQETYLLADRENTNDRFMGFEKRLLTGVRWELFRHATLDVSGGYAFDRYFGVGQNQIGGNLSDQVNVDPGAFLSASVRYRFF
jgi:hypothetical protein